MKGFKIFKCIGILLILAMLFTSLSPVATVYAADDEEIDEEISSVEGMIADLFTFLANAINKIISFALGRMVSIDDFVFNIYPVTRIDFFMDPPGEAGVGTEDGKASELIFGKKGDGTGGLYETINQWYNIFQMVAIMVYMIMLIYMGIRIMLSSTGENTAQYKTLFMHWVAGVVILFFYPYVMKYAIEMNDTFVLTVYEHKNVILEDIKNETGFTPTASVLTSESTDSLETMDNTKSPYDDSGTDYMSEIAKDAKESRRFALALTYIILTWQLLTLAIHYYKRILMVGFLIAIFPIVMTFYVLDKIGDGKSQSFNKWNKEFILNVFIQSFHAIIYVFVIGTVYASRGTTGSYDFILLITGATFLFTGEEIIKKIFSQESPAKTGGLAQTAAGTLAAVGAVKAVGKAVTAPVTGTVKAVTRINNARTEMKNANAKFNMADKLNIYSAALGTDAGLRLGSAQAEMSRIDSDASLSDAERVAQKAEVTRVANAMAAVNNPNSRSAQELAEAYEVLRQAKGTAIGDAIMNDPANKLSTEQLDAMSALEAEVAGLVAGGETSTVEIDRHLKLRLAYMLPSLSDAEQTKYRRMLLGDMVQRGAARYDNPLDSASDEVTETVRLLNGVIGSYTFGDRRDLSELDAEAERLAREFLEGGEELTDDEKDFARSVLVLKSRHSGKFSEEQYIESLNKIKTAEAEGTIDAELAQKMLSTLDADTDILREALAARLLTRREDGDEDTAATEFARNVMAEMTEHGRDGYYDDEVSAHELLAAMAIEDESERNAKIEEIEEEIGKARVRTNAEERELTQAIAIDILSEESEFESDQRGEAVNVLTEGGLDTETVTFEGKTREELLEDRRRAKRNAVLSLIGVDSWEADKEFGTEDKGYSDEYIRNEKARRAHFYGDNPTNKK